MLSQLGPEHPGMGGGVGEQVDQRGDGRPHQPRPCAKPYRGRVLPGWWGV